MKYARCAASFYFILFVFFFYGTHELHTFINVVQTNNNAVVYGISGFDHVSIDKHSIDTITKDIKTWHGIVCICDATQHTHHTTFTVKVQINKNRYTTFITIDGWCTNFYAKVHQHRQNATIPWAISTRMTSEKHSLLIAWLCNA